MRSTFVVTYLFAGLLGCSHPLSQPAGRAAEPRPESGCFGGPVETVQDPAYLASIDLSDRNGNPMFIGDGHLLWSSREGMDGPHLFDLAAGKWGLSPGRNAYFKTADSREVYSVSLQVPGTNEMEMSLVAVDLQTGHRRQVVSSKDRGGVAVWSQVALDGDFVYFIRARLDSAPGPHDGFYRARRDGTGAVERMGDEPKGAYTPFLLHDGYVYWNRDPDFRDPGQRGPAMWRRRLVADSPVERLASTHDHHLSMAIADGRLFYLDGREILSLPLDGSAPPRAHVKDTGLHANNVVVRHGCVYWGSERGILRAGLGAAGKPEIIVDEANYSGGPVGSDGTHLYWFDLRNDRIMRSGRGDHVLAPPPILVAKPIDGLKLPPDAAGRGSAVWVGDGWGCAKVFGWNQPRWQCWHAGGGKGAPVRGQHIPWLSPQAAPVIAADRFCFPEGKQGRCWPASSLGPTPPPDFSEPARKGVGGGRPTGQVEYGPLMLGTSFDCTIQPIGAERMLQCAGDDSFGQLATKDQPVMLDPWIGALAGWHGCVASKARPELACWGRGDAGQLGRKSEAACTVGGHRIACDANVRPVDFSVGRVGRLYGGDLFTCMNEGIHGDLSCWGGSRDGWLGDTPCPAELRQAWPVGNGFVAAPRATCTATPVKVPPFAWQHAISIGSRGMCASVDGKPRCLGAIATPDVPVDQMVVSPGSRASACGIADSRVVCWGEDYSPTNTPGQTVAIGFAASTPVSAVVDFPPPTGGAWSDDHIIRTGCDHPAEALPTCAPGGSGQSWAALLASGGLQKSSKIAVRDRLVVGLPADSTEASDYCNTHRCEHGHHRELRHIVLGDGAEPLRLWPGLARFDCAGDESRLCCGLQAFGQTVVATGELVGAHEQGWRLKVESLCEVSPTAVSGKR